MTHAGDDDHDDDAQLQQLRAVWVSMRDEDPPERGLSALMAAAREKASELEQAAQPAWWQRVLAALRRPPVLALATVTVLLGGAVVLTQRRADLAVDQTATSETATNETTELSRAAGEARRDETLGTLPAAGSAVAFEQAAATEPATATTTAMPEPGAIQPSVKAPSRDPRPRPKAPATTAGPSRPKADFAAKPDDDAPPPPAPEASEAGPRGGAGASPLSIAQDDVPSAAPSADTGEAVGPQTKKPIGRMPAPSIEGEDRQVTKDSSAPTQPTLEQLVKQCEAAAARGDCAQVRALAQKIQTRSPDVFKRRVANQAAIQRCLPAN